MFGEDCIVGEAYGEGRWLSKNGSHDMQTRPATALILVSREGESYVAQVKVKRKVGAIWVVGWSTLRGVQSEAFRFSRSEDLRLNLGTILSTEYYFTSLFGPIVPSYVSYGTS